MNNTSSLVSSHVDFEPRSGSLGNNAKSSSAYREDSRKSRFSALTQARLWLYADAKSIAPHQFAGKVHRTHDCHYSPLGDVKVFQSAHGAHFGNLATCGSVWACPVCAAKIQQRRRPELAKLIEKTYSMSMTASLITLTFPHLVFDTLADLIAKQRAAFKRLRSGRRWVEFKSKYGYHGLVRSLEVTIGRNGWHPHTHELWIHKPLTEVEAFQMRFELAELWLSACAKAGLVDLEDADKVRSFLSYAVDMRTNASCSDYLAKQDSSRNWGADREVALAKSKAGKASGLHPHDLLVRAEKGDAQKYIEYVTAMKGSRQIFWSRGLKAWAGVDDVSDEYLAQQQEEDATEVCELTRHQWAAVIANDCRAELLSAAETGGSHSVFKLLSTICDVTAFTDFTFNNPH
jgi:hypothetical protein